MAAASPVESRSSSDLDARSARRDLPFRTPRCRDARATRVIVAVDPTLRRDAKLISDF
jgi:hypothetical protein